MWIWWGLHNLSQLCSKECFVPEGPTILPAFPKQCWLWTSLNRSPLGNSGNSFSIRIIDLQGKEPWEPATVQSFRFLYLLFPSFNRTPSQLCHSQRKKTILPDEKRGYIYAVVPATFFLIVSELSKTKMEYVFLSLSTLTPSNTTFGSPKILESGTFM